jgi:chromosome partitioning protein
VARVIVIANQKGGVGKTTTAINLAACIAVAEKPTLLIDIDPQANATSGVGVTAEEGKSIYEVLVEDRHLQEIIVETQVPFLSIAPSHVNLVGAEIELINFDRREYILKDTLGAVERRFEYIIIDCPPSLGLLTLNALTASDSVLIPVQCEYFALEGLGQLFRTVNLVKKTFNPDLEIEGVLMTMYDSRLRLSNQILEEVRKYFGAKLFKTIIMRNIRLSEAPSFGKPIVLYDAVSTGSKNYMDLAGEVIQRQESMLVEQETHSRKRGK